MARGRESAKKAAAARACTPPMGGSVIPDVDDVAPVLHCGIRVSNLPSPKCIRPIVVQMVLIERYESKINNRKKLLLLHINRMNMPSQNHFP